MRGLICLPIIINTCFFDSPTFEKEKYLHLLQLCHCYAFEPNSAYLCKGWRSYRFWISRALTQIWLLWSPGYTHTQQEKLLDGDPAEWLSLCLLCLSHFAGTTVFFSFIRLNCPIWETNSKPLPMQKIIQSCILATKKK